MESRDAREHWETEAESWIALTQADPLYEFLNKPSFLELVPAPGRLTVDVGCGEGRMARELIARGHRVVGVDGSATLAEAAHDADARMRVGVADVARLPIATGVADLVVCFMVLMDVEDLDGVVHELARVLVPGGVLCAAILHPIMTSGLFVPGDPNQTFYMGEYARPMRHLLEIERKHGGTFSFRIEHRPIECYSRAFEAAGLAITHLREPLPTDEVVAQHPEFGRSQRVPQFLHLRAARLV
jgi:SAM-dependent methyltransferase